MELTKGQFPNEAALLSNLL